MGEDIFGSSEPIDLIAFEAAFFEKCHEERCAKQEPGCSSHEDAPDSGFSTSREPLVHTTEDNRHAASKMTILKGRLKARILAVDQFKETLRVKCLFLGTSTLSFHILDMLDLPPSNLQPTADPLFVVENGIPSIRPAVLNRVVFGCSFNCIQRIVSSYASVRLKLDDILAFAEFHNSRYTTIPRAVEALCIYLEKFYLHYSSIVKKMKQNPPSLGSLKISLKHLIEEIDFLYSIVHPLSGVISWSWTETELFWAVFYNSFGGQYLLPDASCKLAKELQDILFPCLFDIMDSIYCSGIIPPSHVYHFVLYSDDDNPHILNSRLPKRNDLSLLWDEMLIGMVIRGALLSHNLYDGTVQSDRFRKMFLSIIKNAEDQEKLMNAFTFRRTFRSAVRLLNAQLEIEFNKKLRQGGVIEILQDIKSFAIGKACQMISSRLFHILAHKAYKVDLLFNGVLNECDMGRFCSWSLSHAHGELFGKLGMQVKKPLSSILTSLLIDATTNSLNFWIKLKRVEDLLCNMLREHSAYLYVEGTTGRKFRILVSRLFRIIQILREQFVNKTTNIFDICFRMVHGSSSGLEIENSVKKLSGELMAMTDKNASQRIREALGLVDHYAELVDEIMLNLISRTISGPIVAEWSKKTTRSLQYLTTIGKCSAQNNLFNNAYLRLRYEECSERLNLQGST